MTPTLTVGSFSQGQKVLHYMELHVCTFLGPLSNSVRINSHEVAHIIHEDVYEYI